MRELADLLFYGLGAYVGIVLILELIKHINNETDRDANGR
jgi:hypothetical protein